MAVGLPIGTVRVSRREHKTPRAYMKVSHHGPWRKRWRPVYPGSVGTIRELLNNPATERKRRANQLKSVRISNREREREATQKEINPLRWYVLIHGIPETSAVERWKAKREGVIDPRGLIVMKPCRTKKQAVVLGSHPEFGGVQAGVAKGEWLQNDPDTIAATSGYVRYQMFEGQAWVQKRTQERLAKEAGETQ